VSIPRTNLLFQFIFVLPRFWIPTLGARTGIGGNVRPHPEEGQRSEGVIRAERILLHPRPRPGGNKVLLARRGCRRCGIPGRQAHSARGESRVVSANACDFVNNPLRALRHALAQ
jgi:hypothetical protein